MKSSHCPKYERKNLKNSALSIQDKIFQIFCSYFGQCDDFIFSFWNLLTFRHFIGILEMHFELIFFHSSSHSITLCFSSKNPIISGAPVHKGTGVLKATGVPEICWQNLTIFLFTGLTMRTIMCLTIGTLVVEQRKLFSQRLQELPLDQQLIQIGSPM